MAAPAVNVDAVQTTSEASATSDGLTSRGTTTRSQVPGGAWRRRSAIVSANKPDIVPVIEPAEAVTRMVAPASSASCIREGTASGVP